MIYALLLLIMIVSILFYIKIKYLENTIGAYLSVANKSLSYIDNVKTMHKHNEAMFRDTIRELEKLRSNNK